MTWFSTGEFDRIMWSEHVRIISGLSGLHHCRLSLLSYKFKTGFRGSGDYMIIAGHGEYRIIPGDDKYPCSPDNDEFFLLFRDGQSSIEMAGDDMCEQLKDLACYVAAAEAQKVQDIVSAGCVDNFVVGIIDEVED